MSEQKGAYKAALNAAIVTTAGAVLSILNPEGADLIITRLLLDITTEATGAANVDAGIAANGTTSSDTLIDAGDVGSAAAILDNADATDQGTNGKASRKWGAAQYLTITASATLADMVGNAYIEYMRE
ncbi:MAG: hypothetical protein V3S69_07005 [Dehalococcoidales bacterium]